MRPSDRLTPLDIEHSPAAIKTRLAMAKHQSYLGDFVLGAIDGCVTTFAVVSGAVGANLPHGVAIIVGFANLAADGFSMAASNYQRAKSDLEWMDKARRSEERHVETIPEGEREEIRQIFAAKGFSGEQLEQAVQVITRDRRRWVDTMMTDELGLRLAYPNPLRAALVTFAGFCGAGLVPLLPFFLPAAFGSTPVFLVSVVATALTFVAIGTLKGQVLNRSKPRAAFETFVAGSVAAALAYAVGVGLKELVHAI
ncbi:MAG: VIT1/CCC1 transporter family protein [Gammaproteobacteria bacterium]|nr:VIT1/CCC1 transporter family protein [Gammaproteobacteria bacterium]